MNLFIARASEILNTTYVQMQHLYNVAENAAIIRSLYKKKTITDEQKEKVLNLLERIAANLDEKPDEIADLTLEELEEYNF